MIATQRAAIVCRGVVGKTLSRVHNARDCTEQCNCQECDFAPKVSHKAALGVSAELMQLLLWQAVSATYTRVYCENKTRKSKNRLIN